jgi:hypothetical protein
MRGQELNGTRIICDSERFPFSGFHHAMIILEFIIECFFYTVCGWLGHIVVKTVTLGKVNLEWGAGVESVVADWIGLFFVLVVAGLIAWIVNN